MMGWTDHFINYATEYLMDCKNTGWNWVLLAWLFAPVAAVTLGQRLADEARGGGGAVASAAVAEGLFSKSLELAAGAAEAGAADASSTGADGGGGGDDDDETASLLDTAAGVHGLVGSSGGGEAGRAAVAVAGVRLVRRLAAATAACLCVGSVISYGGLSAESLSSWLHPVLMSLGCVWLMTEGVVHRFLPGFRDGTAPPPPAAGLPAAALASTATAAHAVRTAPHKRAQQGAGLLVALGFLHAVALKWRAGLSAVPSSPHAVLGFLSAGGVAVQVVVGLAKHAKLVPSGLNSGAEPERAHKWHGALGWFVYACCLASAVIGVAQVRKSDDECIRDPTVWHISVARGLPHIYFTLVELTAFATLFLSPPLSTCLFLPVPCHKHLFLPWGLRHRRRRGGRLRPQGAQRRRQRRARRQGQGVGGRAPR